MTIEKNANDAMEALFDMIDDLHRKIVIEDEQDVEKIAEHISNAAKKMLRPKVIDGGRT